MHRYYTRPSIDTSNSQPMTPAKAAPSSGQDEQSSKSDTPPRKHTQEDQDKADQKARDRALKDLVQSWQDRLQLITLLTTFLASVEASMLQVTDPQDTSGWSQAANASFMASMVLHLYASFISFLASFFLIRFKIKEAKREEQEAGIESQPAPKGSTVLDMAAHFVTSSPKSTIHEKNGISKSPNTPIWSANPQLVQTGPFQSHGPPVNLLSRCHTWCMFTTAIGFVLAIVGTLCYAWAGQTTSVAIITSVTIGACLVSCVAIVLPQHWQNGPSSHLFTYHYD